MRGSEMRYASIIEEERTYRQIPRGVPSAVFATDEGRGAWLELQVGNLSLST